MNPDQTPVTTPPSSPEEANLHPMVVLQPGERVICDIKRHPFGIMAMYAAALIAVIIVIVLAFMAPNIFTQSASSTGTTSDGVVRAVQAGAIVFCALIVLVLLVATVVYWQNHWIVTDDSITQITQDSLFGRRVSQLSMENLEDVTIDQHGILQTLFDFGTLRAETAGEKSKFVFAYCPNPKKMARAILEVHENFLHQIRHQPQQVNPVMPISGPDYQQMEQNSNYAAQPGMTGAGSTNQAIQQSQSSDQTWVQSAPSYSAPQTASSTNDVPSGQPQYLQHNQQSAPQDFAAPVRSTSYQPQPQPWVPQQDTSTPQNPFYPTQNDVTAQPQNVYNPGLTQPLPGQDPSHDDYQNHPTA